MTAPDEGEPRRRRLVIRFWLLVFPVVVLAALLGAIAAGLAPDRLRPIAAYWGVTTAMSILFWAGGKRVRFRKQPRRSEVPTGVRLGSAPDSTMMMIAMPVGIGGVLATLAAAIGFPSVGLGALLMFVAIGVGLPFLSGAFAPRAITFETDGLRIHLWGASFLLPWANVSRIESAGPDHSVMVVVHFTERRAVVATALPASARARARVERFLGTDLERAEGQVMLMPGIGNVPGRALVAALEEAVNGKRPDGLN